MLFFTATKTELVSHTPLLEYVYVKNLLELRILSFCFTISCNWGPSTAIHVLLSSWHVGANVACASLSRPNFSSEF